MSALRFRVWVAGQLRLEEWLDERINPAASAEAAQRHAALAMASGHPWLVEIYDPDADEANAYVRFGTDTAGMVEPHKTFTSLARELGLEGDRP